MRFTACLPPSWWQFCFEQAMHVYNRTPNKRLNWKTPYEMFRKEKPDVSSIRVMGCGAYVHIPKETRQNKLAPKSEFMCYIGQDTEMNSFRFMRLKNNTIFHSSNATFDETVFPMCPTNKRSGFTPLGSEAPEVPDFVEGPDSPDDLSTPLEPANGDDPLPDLPTDTNPRAPHIQVEPPTDTSSGFDQDLEYGTPPARRSPARSPSPPGLPPSRTHPRGRSPSMEYERRMPQRADFAPRPTDQTEIRDLPRRSGRTRFPVNRPENIY